jgi:hypothetical protein
MKTKIFLSLFFAIFVALLANGQTIQQKRALQKIDSKIEQLIELQSIFEEIYSLEARLNPSYGWGPTGAEKAAIESRLNNLSRRLAVRQRSFATNYSSDSLICHDLSMLALQKQAIQEVVVTEAIQQTTPKELRNLEKKRRNNSLEIQSGEIQIDKERLSLEKLQATDSYTNGVMGYKVIIWNKDRQRDVNFNVTDLSGKVLDKGDLYLFPGQKKEIYLLPGEYKAVARVSGRRSEENIFPVDPFLKYVGDEACHGFVIYNTP